MDRLRFLDAKDGNPTCEAFIEGGWKALYSTYKPKQGLRLPNLDLTKPILLLGLGLGYELETILNVTTQKIYVVEKEAEFLRFISEREGGAALLQHPQVCVLQGNEYKKQEKGMQEFQVCQSASILCDPGFYLEVTRFFTPSGKSKIVFFDHVTIARDCMDALRVMGHDVVCMFLGQKDKLVKELAEHAPSVVFTINTNEFVMEVTRRLGIPYVAWVVDSPCYSMYSRKMLENCACIFHYDEDVVQQFRRDGAQHVHYLPVGANVDRLNAVIQSSHKEEDYQCEVSFLGSSGEVNEYNEQDLEHKLSKDSLRLLDGVMKEQSMCPGEFLLRRSINPEIVQSVEKDLSCDLNPEELMSKQEKLAFLMGRKFNELERKTLVHELGQGFQTHVYGDETWKDVVARGLKYMGVAEHFTEMPHVFKHSKVNVNLTRVYVDAGLPMRVFDVLGSGGFLATNDKKGLNPLFSIGEDLVLFKDVEHLKEVVRYYLDHEDERQEIAENGYRKVCEKHTFVHRMGEALDVLKRYIDF